MRRAIGPTSTRTDLDQEVARSALTLAVDAENWAWPNPLGQLVDVLECAVVRRRKLASAPDLSRV